MQIAKMTETLHTRVHPGILNEIDRIQSEYSNPAQEISKAALIREALTRGLVLVEEELKAMDTKKARSTDEG